MRAAELRVIPGRHHPAPLDDHRADGGVGVRAAQALHRLRDGERHDSRVVQPLPLGLSATFFACA